MSKDKSIEPNYQKTIYACFVGYIVQAIVNNFAPLLFLTFQKEYHIPLSQITLLVTINFGLQLLVDLLAVGFVDRIGYRASVIIAHFCSAAGLVALALLPELFSDPFIGLLIAVFIYAVGGGLLEVLVSPMVEACPTENKEKTMSMLHSFYCWGYVGMVLVSSLFFAVMGIENWKILACAWALVPFLNAFSFTKTPIATLSDDSGIGLKMGELFRNKVFWILLLLMVCAGASEQSVNQWASTFAEQSLGVSKTVGDLAGPMMFAVMMGVSRTIYGKYGHKIDFNRFMICSGLLCAFSYLVISLSPWPVLGLVGCAVCGFAVGIMWPGTFSLAAVSLKGGGTTMFALLALAGDLGCSGGPTFVGFVSGAFGDNLKAGILAAILFPVVLVIGILVEAAGRKRNELCSGDVPMEAQELRT